MASEIVNPDEIREDHYDNNERRSKWVIDVSEELDRIDKSKEMEHWKNKCIYKVPACVTDLNKKAYKPQLVSFGPYHHGEAHLSQMEDHKHRSLVHFLYRSKKPVEAYMNALSLVVQPLMDSYDWLDPKWLDDHNRFLQLMMLDGCFMLEILRFDVETTDDYAFNDPIFSHHGELYIIPYLRRDMLMLQNQLPMLLLGTLLAVETSGGKPKDEEFLNRIISKFCSPSTPIKSMGQRLHVLDVYRKILLQDPRKNSRRAPHGTIPRDTIDQHGSTSDIIRSALELHEAGIRFKKSKTISFKDISFHGGVLRLPVIVVDDTTESTFLNLMAFERFHVGAGNDITAYVFFMDNIIDSAKDVSILHSSGIIHNAIGSDKAVAKLFNRLSKDVTLDPDSSLEMVHKRVNYYCRKRWNAWRANLVHTYFRNPWAILSLLAAIFLMALTIAQSVFAIMDYYNPDSIAPSPSPK